MIGDMSEQSPHAALDDAIRSAYALPEHERPTWASLAREHCVTPWTVIRRRKALGLMPYTRVVGDVERDDFFDDVPLSEITERRRTVRLPDGSYERVTYRPRATDAQQALTAAEHTNLIRDLLTSEPPARADHPSTRAVSAGVPVLAIADLQLGKTDERGGTDGTLARVRRAVSGWCQRITQDGWQRRIVIADVGDLIEGVTNVTSQRQTNDRHLTYQLREAHALWAWILRCVAPLADDVIIAAVPSNHCQVRTCTGKGSRAATPGDDYGLMIHAMLQEAARDMPGMQHIRWVTPPEHEESVTIEVDERTVLGLTHGHLAGRQSRVPDWWQAQAFGCRSGLDRARVLLHGHWHNLAISTVGDGRMIVSTPSADPGSSWWANLSGDSAPAGVLAMRVGSGTCWGWEAL